MHKRTTDTLHGEKRRKRRVTRRLNNQLTSKSLHSSYGRKETVLANIFRVSKCQNILRNDKSLFFKELFENELNEEQIVITTFAKPFPSSSRPGDLFIFCGSV